MVTLVIEDHHISLEAITLSLGSPFSFLPFEFSYLWYIKSLNIKNETKKVPEQNLE